MSARRITRRTLLGACAGVMASGLLRPRTALALLSGPGAPTLTERWLGEVTPSGVSVELGRPVDLVGLEWHAGPRTGVWLRFRGRDGRWSRWASAAANGHGPEAHAAAGREVGEPIWTGGATAVEIRAARRLNGAQLHLVDVGRGVPQMRSLSAATTALAGGLTLASPSLAAGPGQPPIIARRAWADTVAKPKVAPEYGAVRMAFVHHTENPNGYAASEVPAMLRAIYAFHRYVNGWDDIGYNFVVDLYGRIFEARAGGIDEPVVGAHAGGYNLASTGVAVLGSFMAAPISSAARRALEALLAWKLSLHGIPAQGTVTVRVNPAGASYSRFPANARVPLPRIAGHRDGDATDCPGNVLYGELASIRNRVQRLAPNPTRVTLALSAAPPAPAAALPAGAPPAPSAPATPVAPQAQLLSGLLERLDGSPVTGAPIMIQARSVSRRGEVVSEQTLAETRTDAAGGWAFDATPIAAVRGGIWLRALFSGAPGVGVCVSDPLRVATSLSLTAAG
jgi:N-acetylmuramoyl-L-alanine amidase